MVIGFISYDRKGPIQLFGEKKTHHLVGEGHFGHSDFFIRPIIKIITESVRTPNYKVQVFESAVHFFLNVF